MADEMINHHAMAPQSPDDVSILLAGDLVLDVPEADHWLSGIAGAVRSVDVAIGHLEVPHTRHVAAVTHDIPAPGAPPENLGALARAGFTAVTLAGNHIADCGAEGIADTIAELDRLGIAHAGAGADLARARRPALLESRGRFIALLSYNCVGPQGAWAAEGRAGSNYLPILTADGSRIRPTAPLERVDPAAFELLRADVAEARSVAQLVVVAFHKGIVHTPAVLAPYERPLAEAAIDAGADVVVGHHAHILRGVELYRGRPIFHGIGNGCVVTHALSPAQDHPGRAEWARRRRELFGFEPDPAYTLAPFHPEAVNAILGVLTWRADGRLETAVQPVFVEAPGRPVCVADAHADAVVDYLDRIGAAAGLPPRRWVRQGTTWVCH